MKTKINVKMLFAALVAAFCFGSFNANEAKAQESVSLYTYKVQVKKFYYRWTGGGTSTYWYTVLETSNYGEAAALYETLREDFDNGEIEYLESSGPTSVTTVIDVRMTTTFNRNLLLAPRYSNLYSSNLSFTR